VKKYLKDKQYYVEILDDDQWAFDGDYGKSWHKEDSKDNPMLLKWHLDPQFICSFLNPLHWNLQTAADKIYTESKPLMVNYKCSVLFLLSPVSFLLSIIHYIPSFTVWVWSEFFSGCFFFLTWKPATNQEYYTIAHLWFEPGNCECKPRNAGWNRMHLLKIEYLSSVQVQRRCNIPHMLGLQKTKAIYVKVSDVIV
jgi:hypothetical protein